MGAAWLCQGSDTSYLCPGTHTFHEDFDDFIHIEAQLIHVLAHVLVQCPAPRAMRPWLGLGSAHTWHRPLPHATLPLHAVGTGGALVTAQDTPPITCPPPGAALPPHLPSHALIWHVEEFCVVLRGVLCPGASAAPQG